MIAVDIGNTKIGIGLFQGGDLVRRWRIGTNVSACFDDFRITLTSLLTQANETLSGAGEMVLSSVVPSLTEEWSKFRDELPLHVISAQTPTSFEIAIPDPSTLGADRIADLEAGIRKYGAPLIVVATGTAISVSAVNARRQFVGGAIAPGVGISMNALFNSAAQLSRLPLHPPEKAIGTNTRTALESGLHMGFASLVDGLVERFRKELGDPTVRVVASGGAVERLAPFFQTQPILDPELTLSGLAYLYDNLKRGKGVHV